MSDIDRAIVEVDAALIHIDRAGARCDEMDYDRPRELCALWLDETQRARAALSRRNVYTALPLLVRAQTTGDQVTAHADKLGDKILSGEAGVALGYIRTADGVLDS